MDVWDGVRVRRWVGSFCQGWGVEEAWRLAKLLGWFLSRGLSIDELEGA